MLADTAAIEVGADVFYHIADAEKSVSCIQDLNYSLRVLGQTSLHKNLSRHSLNDIEASKTTLAFNVKVKFNYGQKSLVKSNQLCHLAFVIAQIKSSCSC